MSNFKKLNVMSTEKLFNGLTRNDWYEIFRENCYKGVFGYCDKFRDLLFEPIDECSDVTWDDVFCEFDDLEDWCCDLFRRVC